MRWAYNSKQSATEDIGKRSKQYDNNMNHDEIPPVRLLNVRSNISKLLKLVHTAGRVPANATCNSLRISALQWECSPTIRSLQHLFRCLQIIVKARVHLILVIAGEEKVHLWKRTRHRLRSHVRYQPEFQNYQPKFLVADDAEPGWCRAYKQSSATTWRGQGTPVRLQLRIATLLNELELAHSCGKVAATPPHFRFTLILSTFAC